MRLALLLAFASCANGATMLDYMPHASGDHVAGMLLRQDSREQASEWIAYGGGMLEWRDPHKAVGNFEHMSFRGDGFVYLDSLDQWSITCLRAELEWAGVITSIPCGGGGHPYVPRIIPHDTFEMRAWLDVGGQKAFWQARFTPGVTATNPCWYQGATTVTDAIEQKDSWWGANAGWSRATGTSPFDAAGNMVRPIVNYLYTITLAKGYGVWTINDNGFLLCAYSNWKWN